ncbi:type IV pilus assembly protein FimV [Ramlibacter albus]|uniref:Tfp pilus assembly protein FimV n=1 Tax=Ramlibacter albus TaxID=2079448 RepID=A0A923MBH6_9BURK|nr:hypothetical protein [Ramlibacter albus]MBC5767757.1 hypothetical protein [Ramlibacter albus]
MAPAVPKTTNAHWLSRTVAALAFGAAALCGSLSADAMTLGRPRGAVLIGKPLSVTIPLTLEAGEAEPCVQAELFQGDTRTGPLDVSIVQAEGGARAIRVLSPASVDEPVITIYLRVGCAQQFTRSFVMLAEQVVDQPSSPIALAPSTGLTMAPRLSDAQQVQQATAPATPGEAPLSLQPSTSSTWSGSPQPGGGAQASASTTRPPSAQPSAPARQAAAGRTAARTGEAAAAARPRAQPRVAGEARAQPRVAGEPRAQAARTGAPRLRLEAAGASIDFAVEQAAPLKLTPNLGSASRTQVVGAVPGSKPAIEGSTATAAVAAASAASAAPAAAAAPAASGTPVQLRAETSMPERFATKAQEELAGQVQRSAAVEAEVKALREAMQKHTAATAQLAEQLDKVRGERDFASTLLAVIAGLLIAGGVAMLWLRSRESTDQQSRWRQLAAAPPAAADLRAREGAASAGRASHGGPVSEVDSGWEGISQVNSSGGNSSDEDVDLRRNKPAVSSPMSEFAESQVGQSRLPKPQELIDIQQKVEFFLAIGQHERAIELLEQQVHDYLGSSPLLWLDLLDLCHQHGKREQYERIREEFQREFNARLPAFEANRPDSGGLEDHPRALSRIEQLWGSPRVLQVIEDALAEDGHAPGSITFDLHASRDLLLLYVIARETVPGAEGPVPSPEDDYTEFIRTSMVPAMPNLAAALDFPEVPEGGAAQPGRSTEPVPLATLDEPAQDLPPVAVSPDIDLSFITAPLPEVAPSADPEAPAPAPTPAPEGIEFDFDFEPRARKGGGQTIL